MTTSTHTAPLTATGPRTIAPAIFVMLLGAFFLFGAGIAQSDVLHNAAHDSRHSFAFPCH